MMTSLLNRLVLCAVLVMAAVAQADTVLDSKDVPVRGVAATVSPDAVTMPRNVEYSLSTALVRADQVAAENPVTVSRTSLGAGAYSLLRLARS